LDKGDDKTSLHDFRFGGLWLKFSVVEVLGLISAVGADRALIDVLHQDPVFEVKIRAVRALGRLGTPAALGPLLDAARAEQVPVLRTVAAQALGQLGIRSLRCA
jgi:HEAT repeat protein